MQHNISSIHIFLVACTFILTGCSSTMQHRIIISGDEYTRFDWNNEELQQDIAARTLHNSDASSSHLVRLNGREEPHYHDYHDLYVSILSGESTIHFRNHDIKLKPGAFVIIPRGTYHWAENRGIEASILVTVFTPAFDGKDKRFSD